MKIIRKKRPSPEVSTASLPDIIFMLLFFFMTVTVLKTATPLIPVELPTTDNAVKIEHQSSEHTIYISQKKEKPQLQYNQYIVSKEQLQKTLQNIAAPLMEFEKMEQSIYLRVDKQVPMQLVYDVKLMLRKNGLRKINYVVEQGGNSE